MANREVKFRAFIDGQIVDVLAMKFEGEESRVLLTGYKGRKDVSSWYLINQIKLLQFIGIRDLNNIDIYEGDILRCVNPKELVNYIPAKAPRIRFYVMEWDDNKFIAKSQHPYPYNQKYYWPHISGDLEVISNIYITPEIIKDIR